MTISHEPEWSIIDIFMSLSVSLAKSGHSLRLMQVSIEETDRERSFELSRSHSHSRSVLVPRTDKSCSPLPKFQYIITLESDRMDGCANPIQVYLLFTETISRQNTDYNTAIIRNNLPPKHGINKQFNLISISLWLLVLKNEDF